MSSSRLFLPASSMALVLEGLVAATSIFAYFIVSKRWAWDLAAALSTGLSLRYSLESPFPADFLNFGDLGIVFIFMAFFELSFELNLSCYFLNCFAVTSSLIWGLNDQVSTSYSGGGAFFIIFECNSILGGSFASCAESWAALCILSFRIYSSTSVFSW